jgi:anti-sigma factor RsiW
MSCDKFERLIALDAGGDLAPAEAERVRSHIETCGRCGELARSIRESQAALKTLADTDAVDEQALAVWRRGVLRRIENEPRRPRVGWIWVGAAAAALALVVLLLVPVLRRPPAVPAPAASVTRMAPPSLQPAPQRTVVAKRHPHRRHRARVPAPAEPLLVKLETPDPNVVIYWIVDRKGN